MFLAAVCVSSSLRPELRSERERRGGSQGGAREKTLARERVSCLSVGVMRSASKALMRSANKALVS